jgi:hypothetical protein
MHCWECMLCSCRLEYSVDVCKSHSILDFFVIFFVLITYLLVMKKYWSLTLPLCWGVSVFSSLMKLGEPTLGAYKLMIIIYSWCVAPFISMKWPSLSLLSNLGLKSTLSDISIATPVYFLGPLAWQIIFYPFTLRQCL